MPRKLKYGHVGDVITLHCVDCDRPYQWTVQRGQPTRRCPKCWEINERTADAVYARRWREANPERMREINREHYRRVGGYEWIRDKEARDPEFKRQRRETSRRYHQTPRGRQVSKNAKLRRRRAEHECGGRMISHDEWEYTLWAFGDRCVYCDSEGPMTQDHFCPLSCGGLTILGNIVPACKSCNSWKHDRLPEDILSEEHYNWIVNVLCELSQD